MSELLLELLSEEIPARMQSRAIEGLTGLLHDKLAAAQIPAESIRGYVTPRRLTVVAEGIPAAQPDRTEERRGPRVGATQPAIDGFLRSAGLAALTECKIRDTDRGEFYFAVVNRSGRAAHEVLPELIQGAMAELPWPKSMRYPASDLRWVRPLISVLCMLDGDVLPLPLGRVPVGTTTRGHRFLAPGEICVTSAADYVERLRRAHVVLDRDCRIEAIRQGLEEASAAEGLSLKPDVELLDEVAGLVEFPVVLAGAIDADFIALPPEVLSMAMRTHQKYFSCLWPDGTPAPRFLFVANNVAVDRGGTIIAGNERVLRARLADARFFWDHDRRVPLESRIEALKDRVFHAKLGSVYDKTERIAALSELLAGDVPGADPHLSRRATRLAKADLSTGMVGEFPELQGIMGRYYALHDGEDERVANAIADHYKPQGPYDFCPRAPESIVAALADKIDSLAAFFAIGEAPTGSRDPFALRRAAQGIIRLILENGLRVSLRAIFACAADALGPEYPDATGELLAFIADRLKVHLRGEGFGIVGGAKLTLLRHDLIAAVFALDEDDLVRLLARAAELAGFLATEEGTNLLVAYRRASNIVAIEERRDHRRYDHDVQRKLLREPEEFALAANLDLASDGAMRALAREEFDAAMGHLATLRRPVDEFFDRVTVNTEEPKLRENRLRLLSAIRATMNRVADFSQIEG